MAIVQLPIRRPVKARPRNKFKFTETSIADLVRHEGSGRPPIYYYDTAKAGLAVRVTEGTKTYCFYGRIHGRVQRVTLGRAGSLSLSKARDAVDGIRGDIASGVDPISRRKALRAVKVKPTTLAVAFEAYVSGSRHAEKTKKDYRSLWDLYVAGPIGKKAVIEITADDVRRLHSKIIKTVGAGRRGNRPGAGQRSANAAVILLRAILNQAGRKSDNPAASLKMKAEKPRRRRLSDEEAVMLSKALADFDPAWRDFFTLTLLTGARRKSLLTMRWSDIDLDRRRWIVPAKWSKNGDELVVPLVEDASAYVREMRKRRGSSLFVFPSSRSRSGHIEEPKRAWAKLLSAAGLSGLTIHDMRRTFGSRLAEEGANAAVISAAMGHKSLASAKAYLHLQTDHVREAMEKAKVVITKGDRDAQA
jgi:integrase